jgi:hypothetical protein
MAVHGWKLRAKGLGLNGNESHDDICAVANPVHQIVF